MAEIAAQFGRPIPGQSLTKEPGASPWEKPPQFTDIDDAMEFLFNNITNPKNAHKLCALMEAGVPITSIVETILKGGFMEGKWTPDLMIILLKPVSALIMKIGQMYDIEYVTGAEDEDEVEDEFVRLADKRAPSAPSMDQVEPEKPPIPSGGIMSPPEV